MFDILDLNPSMLMSHVYQRHGIRFQYTMGLKVVGIKTVLILCKSILHMRFNLYVQMGSRAFQNNTCTNGTIV